jgi:UDP-N-acetylglucosamine transferase subunit ALG13
MIFVTVGSSISFDRLIRAVDDWAGTRNRRDVFAQIGQTEYKPRNIEAVQLLDPSEFRKHVIAADLIVAHAGMGSIITALENGKPILVLPRRACLLETRNDHQVATAVQFAKKDGVIVAMHEGELSTKLDQAGKFVVKTKLTTEASPELISAIREFIQVG